MTSPSPTIAWMVGSPLGSPFTNSLRSPCDVPASAPVLIPFQKILEQPLAVGGRTGRAGAAAGQEGVELVAHRCAWLLLPRRLAGAVLGEPLLGALEPGPTGQCRRKVDFAPFRVAWRFLQF